MEVEMITTFMKRGLTSSMLRLAVVLAMIGAITLNAKPNHKIWFNNQQDQQTTVGIGQQYTYSFSAQSNDSLAIRYAITEDTKDEFASIDQSTGEFTFQSSQEGNYYYIIKAYDANNADVAAYTTVSIRVSDKTQQQKCATISGLVNTSNGDPVKHINITAIPVKDGNIDSTKDFDFEHTYSANTDSKGNYTISVPEGQYKVFVYDGWGNVLFYNNTQNWDNAQVITIACSQTFTANFTFEIPKHVEFTSFPDKHEADVNEAWQYQAEAVASDSSSVTIVMLEAPEGATINNGLVSFTPTKKGSYEFTLKAYLTSDTTVQDVQQFTIRIGGCHKDSLDYKPCAYIVGHVLDKNGKPVAGAFVGCVETPSENTDWFGYQNTTTTDANGAFLLPVVEGTYLLYVSSDQFGMIAYDSATVQTSPNDQPSYVTLNCGDTITANFTVEPYKEPAKYVVSGRVTDETTGNAIANANVDFINSYNDNDSQWNSNHVYGYSAKTDENGNYSVEVESGRAYYAQAYTDKDHYLPEWYNNVADFSDAQLINVDSVAINNINFTLSKYETKETGFRGIVTDANGKAMNAVVTAFMVKSNDLFATSWISSTMTDQNTGEFTFDQTVPGEYIVYAIPFDTTDYIPGYYKENDFAVSDWSDATSITVGNSFDQTTHVIKLQSIPQSQGVAVLAGKVFSAENGSKANNTLSGVIITAYNVSGEAIACAKSDNDGNYTLNNVASGQVKLVASKYGYDKYQDNMTIANVANQKFDKNIVLAQKVAGTTGINEGDVDNGYGVRVYPNPVTSIDASVIANVKAGSYTMNIYNESGINVYSVNVNLVEGANTIAVNTNSLSNGTYLVKINGAINFTTKFQVVK